MTQQFIPYYRYEDWHFTTPFEPIETVPSPTTYYVVATTPKGVRIALYPLGTKSKLVIHTHKKKFAYPTKEEALISFLWRKKKQKEILNTQLVNCEGILKTLQLLGVTTDDRDN